MELAAALRAERDSIVSEWERLEQEANAARAWPTSTRRGHAVFLLERLVERVGATAGSGRETDVELSTPLGASSSALLGQCAVRHLAPLATDEELGRLQRALAAVHPAQAPPREPEGAEAELRELLAQLPVAVVNQEWRLTQVNGAAEQMMRSTREKLLGQELWQALPALVRVEGAREALQRAMSARSPAQLEEQLGTSSLWVELCAFPVNTSGLALVFRDITEAKRRELESREQARRATFLARASVVLNGSLDYPSRIEELARLLVPEIGDVASVALITDQGRIERIASAGGSPELFHTLEQLRGVPLPDSPEHPVRQVIAGGRALLVEDLPSLLAEDASRFDAFGAIVHALKLRSVLLAPLRGRERVLGWISVGFIRPEDGNGRAHLGLIEEIAGRAALAIENALLLRTVEEQRTLLDAVLEQLPVGVLIAEDGARHVIRSNRKMDELWGAPVQLRDAEGTADGASGRSAWDDGASDRLLELMESHGSSEVRLHRDGGEAVVALSSTPVRSPQGTTIARVVVAEDVTELRRHEQQARQQAEFERQLLGIVSHDLRNPLTAIITTASLLKRYGLNERNVQLVQRITLSSKRAMRMIRDLLDFTQARIGGGIPIERRAMDLNQLTGQIIEELRASHPDRQIEWYAEGNGEGIWDWDRMAQVLVNLLSNALHHGSQSEPVRVATRADGDHVVLEVHNQGKPIPDELVPRLFDPMKRFIRSSGDPRGLGLGLFIVERIVVAHGGRIHVQSTEAQGTTFILRIPRAERGSGAATLSDERPAPL